MRIMGVDGNDRRRRRPPCPPDCESVVDSGPPDRSGRGVMPP